MSKRLLEALADASDAAPVATDLGLDVTPFMELALVPRYLEPAQIELDSKYQKRLKVDENKIAEYADLWTAGHNLSERDPIVVFYITDEKRYVSIDGWHRIKGWIMAKGNQALAVQVATGTATQANAAALGANARHGIARTNEEKRAAVDEALAVFTKPEGRLSNETIAKIVGVSAAFVGKRRKELEEHGAIVAGVATVAANGKVFQSTEAIGTKPQAKNFVTAGAPHSPEEWGEKFNLSPKAITAQLAPATEPRVLTLDETIAVIWRVLWYDGGGKPNNQLLAWLGDHRKPSDYQLAMRSDKTFDPDVFSEAWITVKQDLQDKIRKTGEKAAPVAPSLAPEPTPAPEDWHKYSEPTILGDASFMMVGPNSVSIATDGGEVVIRLEELRAYLFMVDSKA